MLADTWRFGRAGGASVEAWTHQRISEEVVPIYEYVLTHLELDQGAWRLIGAAIHKATWAGASIAAHEAVAQLIEQSNDRRRCRRSRGGAHRICARTGRTSPRGVGPCPTRAA